MRGKQLCESRVIDKLKLGWTVSKPVRKRRVELPSINLNAEYSHIQPCPMGMSEVGYGNLFAHPFLESLWDSCISGL